jgi:twitching motility protein PilT
MAYFDLDPLLSSMLDVAPGISDLNLSVGRPPQVEVDGQLRAVPFAGLERLMPYHTELVAMRLLAGKKDLADKLVRTGSVDLSYSLMRRTRFRVNVFSQRNSYSIVLRVIPNKVPTVEELGLPAQVNEIAAERNGIVLVTGPTGSGKSTTLAAIINKLNREKPIHIITIEDPIEYLHPHAMATINQREVGADTQTFALALRAALRQAPKVILVGEMRDVETISIALEASETGHLVLSTLHTIDAAKTIDRIVGVFPKNEERQIRTRFAQAFKWVVSQRLVPKKGGGRMALCEILRSNSRTREYVQEGEREGKSLLDAMADGALEGMQTFDSELERLINAGEIDRETGLSYSTNRTNLQLRLDTQGSPEAPIPAAKGHAAPAHRRPAPAPAPEPESELDGLIER